jgi:periplasmic protein CpxP/Spy
MERLAKNKLLILLVGILLLANIIMLSFWLFKPKSQNHNNSGNKNSKGMVSGFLKKDLNFTDDQLKRFDTLRSAHFERIKPFYRELNNSKEVLFSQTYSSDSSAIDSLASEIGKRQAEIDKNFLNHFRQIRELCTEEQKPAFDSLFPGLVKKMIHRKR